MSESKATTVLYLSGPNVFTILLTNSRKILYFSALKKMTGGLILAAISFVICAFVQIQIQVLYVSPSEGRTIFIINLSAFICLIAISN